MKKLLLLISICITPFYYSCNTSYEDAPPPFATFETKSQMIIVGSNMYVIDNQELKTYSLRDATTPELKSAISVGFDMLSINAHDEQLFIGTLNATYIYSIANIWAPEYVGTQSSISWCTPLAFKDNYIFATSTSDRMTGNVCGIHSNSLTVYDMNNSDNYSYDTSIYMEDPRGIAQSFNTLYVADYKTGICIFDLTDQINAPFLVNIVDRTQSNLECLVNDNKLYVMQETGFSIFDITTPLFPQKLSQTSFR